MRLIDTEGRELFRGKDLISAQPQSSKARAKQFLAVQEETALLLDRDGNVVKRCAIEGLSSLYCDRGRRLFLRSVQRARSDPDRHARRRAADRDSGRNL